MAKDAWIIDVLTDIRILADDRGYGHLSKALDHAIQAFLGDLEMYHGTVGDPHIDGDTLRDLRVKIRRGTGQ